MHGRLGVLEQVEAALILITAVIVISRHHSHHGLLLH